MDLDAAIIRQIDRCRRGAPVDGGKPAGITVGQHVNGLARLFLRGNRLDQLQTVAGDAPVDLDILLQNFVGTRVSRLRPLQRIDRRERRAHLVERPFEIDGCGPRHHQRLVGALQARIGTVHAHGERHAERGRGTDQRRAAHQHGADRVSRLLARGETSDDEFVRQPALVDGSDRPAVALAPDAAIMLAVDLHGGPPFVLCAQYAPRHGVELLQKLGITCLGP